MKICVSDLLYCRSLGRWNVSDVENKSTIYVCQRATFDSTDGICFSYFRGIAQHFFLEQFIYPPIHPSERLIILNCIQSSILRGRSALLAFVSFRKFDRSRSADILFLFFSFYSSRVSLETIKVVFIHFVCLFGGMRLRLISLRKHFFLSVFSLGVSAKEQHEDMSRQQKLVWAKTVREQLALQGKVALRLE